ANAASGGGGEAEERTRLVLTAFEPAGLVPEVRCVAGPDLERVARQLAAGKPKALVAAGGDGTVSAVAQALVGSEVPLGVLPLGTLNHFAKDVGIPIEPREAAAVIASGSATRVDAAAVNGRYFLNNSSLGVYPQLVRMRDELHAELGGSKRAATLRSSWDVLRRLPLARVTLWVDGRVERIATPLLFIGNNAYGIEGRKLGKRASLTAGKLTVAHTRRTGRAGVALLALRALAGALEDSPDVELEEATSVRVDAPRGHLRVALDGEVFTLRPPLEYRALPGALRVLAPGGARA
ncbi:MAG TPA: diacylglycerol kinase family protein, partial [Candidatus Thermoplasmatota archaeon]|nr:diacylglycerol kinase family protein [Candidatus Thermoplasmatota archaeon]